MRQALLKMTAATFAVGALSLTLHAQTTTQIHAGRGGSPHVKTDWTIDGAKLSITYGRPSIKGRPEATLMAPNQPWRMGADEPTLLTTDKPLTFGTVKLAPGTYTLNATPGAQWQLHIGRLATPPQWGIPYRADLEIGKAPMTAGKTAAPVEQLTITLSDTPAGATLKVEWGSTSASIPFTVG
jgi:hypothetical protein